MTDGLTKSVSFGTEQGASTQSFSVFDGAEIMELYPKTNWHIFKPPGIY